MLRYLTYKEEVNIHIDRPEDWNDRILHLQFIIYRVLRNPYPCLFWFRSDNLKTYKDYKMAATDYQCAWQELLGVFKTWEHKPPGFYDFTWGYAGLVNLEERSLGLKYMY